METVLDLTPLYAERDRLRAEIMDLQASCRKVMEGLSESMKESEALRFEVARLTTAKRRALAIADERSKENCALRQENERLRDELTTLASTMLARRVQGDLEQEGDGK